MSRTSGYAQSVLEHDRKSKISDTSMETRNVQKTGNMHYFYLPTSWCRDRKLSSKSKVSISYGSDGSLVISPQHAERKPKHLKFSIKEDDQDIIHKLVVASYINPAGSFDISLEKELDFTKLLNQKRLISLESVEIDQKQITCQGAVSITSPESLLKTMVKKIRNMMIVMEKNYDRGLIERYEDEMDRSKMLIDKAMIGALTDGGARISTIELYYISSIARELERVVDHLITLEGKDMRFVREIYRPMEILQRIVEDSAKLNLDLSLEFARSVSRIKKRRISDIKSNEIEQLRQNLVAISEVVMDWMVTIKLES